MSNIPYNNKALLKWSAFVIDRNYEDSNKPYKMVCKPLTELVKHPGYEKFTAKLNWLYNNYNEQNYQLVWSELQNHNELRKERCFQNVVLEKAEKKFVEKVEELKLHFGPIPSWIAKLTDNQRKLLLDRAQVCYGLEPEYDLTVVQSKQLYCLPERFIKDYYEDGTPLYYSNQELYKSHTTPNNYKELVGKVDTSVELLRRLAEDAVIRDAHWMSEYNGTEYDLRECRESEGDEHNNVMVPIADMQGSESPYGLDMEFRDFLEPLYGEEDDILD